MNTSAAKPKPDTIIMRTDDRLQFYLIFSKSMRECNVYLCFDFCLKVTLRVLFQLLQGG